MIVCKEFWMIGQLLIINKLHMRVVVQVRVWGTGNFIAQVGCIFMVVRGWAAFGQSSISMCIAWMGTKEYERNIIISTSHYVCLFVRACVLAPIVLEM